LSGLRPDAGDFLCTKRSHSIAQLGPLCRAEQLAWPRGCRRGLSEFSPRRLRLGLSEFHSRRSQAGSTGNAHGAGHRGGLLFGDFSLGRTRESHRRLDV